MKSTKQISVAIWQPFLLGLLVLITHLGTAILIGLAMGNKIENVGFWGLSLFIAFGIWGYWLGSLIYTSIIRRQATSFRRYYVAVLIVLGVYLLFNIPDMLDNNPWSDLSIKETLFMLSSTPLLVELDRHVIRKKQVASQ